ncbi:hypothetical protein NDU88_001060 [Pleurodeles waltl]|uniref:Uncharacterized protein n=1 Tax=Pleurodeles waltl TaxID=8319 RepID=A0AAV7U5G8_PLEWA|nr:hypothetical protein NDU88_001060 [Pleurodeles waltl]
MLGTGQISITTPQPWTLTGELLSPQAAAAKAKEVAEQIMPMDFIETPLLKSPTLEQIIAECGRALRAAASLGTRTSNDPHIFTSDEDCGPCDDSLRGS